MCSNCEHCLHGRSLHHGKPDETVVNAKHVAQSSTSHLLRDLLTLNVVLWHFHQVSVLALLTLSQQVLKPDLGNALALQQFEHVDLFVDDIVVFDLKARPEEDAAAKWVLEEHVRLDVLLHLAHCCDPVANMAKGLFVLNVELFLLEGRGGLLCLLLCYLGVANGIGKNVIRVINVHIAFVLAVGETDLIDIVL